MALVSSRAEEVKLGNSPAARARRKAAREWIKDPTQKQGGYWYASLVPPNEHGQASTYRNWYCTCPPCRKAHTIEKLYRRKERWDERVWVEEGETGYWYAPNAPNHGRSSTFRNWGCHCPPCKRAEKEKSRA